jgi:hypothetical protein
MPQTTNKDCNAIVTFETAHRLTYKTTGPKQRSRWHLATGSAAQCPPGIAPSVPQAQACVGCPEDTPSSRDQQLGECKLFESSANAGGGLCAAATRNRASSYSSKTPKFASQRRVALAKIVSRTVSRFPGEFEIICRTSAVAACCASASSR